MNKLFLSTLLLASVVIASEALEIPKTSDDEGGCYDLSTHQCGCQDDRCSKEKCEANGMIWTATCPEMCDEAECDAYGEDYEEGACYDPTVHSCGCEDDRCSKGKCEDLEMIWSSECGVFCNTTDCMDGNMTEYNITVYEEGACYDPTVHSCGCDDDRCSEEKCEELGMIWSSDCSVTCNATECYSGIEDNEGSACYNFMTHSCGCEDDRCTQEMCEEVGMIWSSECSVACNATECTENMNSEDSEDSEDEEDEDEGEDEEDEDEGEDDILDDLLSIVEGITSLLVSLGLCF